MAPSITAQGLSKRYAISTGASRSDRLTELVAAVIRGRGRGTMGQAGRDDFWALRDVSFEIEPGTALGIVGRNGAGKSTLLRVLARITSPTSGRAVLRGRVASLLEVGTGFHGDLSGRANVYLSGALLGMRRAEIDRKFDEIVAFAGVEQFIDTPIKRYSSGMAVRLGFAVAAHLEPEILLVDEVLAVGDAEFQRKCLGKMEDIGGEGRTIVFVSHSMPAVLRLCHSAMLLDHGRLVSIGPSSEVVATYLTQGTGPGGERRWADPTQAPGDTVARLVSVRVLQTGVERSEEIDITQPMQVAVEYWSEAPGELKPSVNLHFTNDQGVRLFVTNDWNDRAGWAQRRVRGLYESVCEIPGNFLAEGRITVDAAVSTYNPLVVHALEREAVTFQVVDRAGDGGVRGQYAGDWPGVVRPMLTWRTGTSAGGGS